jgi:hypothetical protein
VWSCPAEAKIFNPQIEKVDIMTISYILLDIPKRLVAKGSTRREGIDYTETFSPVSKKDSFRIVITLVAHCDLELHQIDVKTALLNGDLQDVYMAMFFVSNGKCMV